LPATDDQPAAVPAGPFLEHFLPARLAARPDLTATLDGTCQLILQGEGGGRWHLAFAGTVPEVTPGEQPADCSILLTTADFAAILAGRLNPMVALWNGQITLEGDTALAGQIAQLIHAASQDEASPES
jgi:putative sterol carrier protein